MTAGKRLVQYALTSKKTIIVALFLLALSVAAELTGPFIAKIIIDRHVTGIEEPWYPTDKGDKAVQYQGQWYTREANLSEQAEVGSPVQIAQVGRMFVYTEQPIPLNGRREFDEGRFTVTNDGVTYETEAVVLSAAEVMAFYTPEMGPIIRMLSFYVG